MALIAWGDGDSIFFLYWRDLKNLEFHLLDTGHFALEEDGQVISDIIRKFFEKQLFKAKK